MGLTYNGIDLSHTYTESVEQVPEFDPSGVDQLYTRVTVRVRAVVNAALLPSTGLEGAGDTVSRVRHYLTAPRRPLVYTAGGGTVLSVPGGLDDALGPKPELFSVREVTPQTVVVNFAVTARVTDCGISASGLGRKYLSLRWQESTTYDQKWLCVKRRTGYMVVSPNSAVAPDDLRGLVTPDVPGSFRRESAEYQISEDGLTYRFTFVDRELMRPPPFPALKIAGRMVESTPLPGAIRYGKLFLRLDGPKGVTPFDLVEVGVQIGMSRVWAAGVNVSDASGRVLVGGSIAESLTDDENAVELTLEWQMRPSADRLTGEQATRIGGGILTGGGIGGLVGGIPGNIIGGIIGGRLAAPKTKEGKAPDAFPINGNWLGAPLPGSDATRGIAPPYYGLANLVRLGAAALNDPCGSTANFSPFGGNALAGTTLSGAELKAEFVSSNGPPDDSQSLYTSDGNPGVYDHWECLYSYKDDPGNLVLPSSSPAGKSEEVVHSSPTVALRVEWHASRIGSPPEVPPRSQGDNFVYTGGARVLRNMDVAADGVSFQYTATGVYEFAALDAAAVSLEYPAPPYLDATLTRAAAKDGGRQLDGGGSSELTGGPPVGP